VLSMLAQKRRFLFVTLVIFALALATYGCSNRAEREDRNEGSPMGEKAGKASGAVLLVANTDLAVGRNWLALALGSDEGRYLGAKDSTATVEIAPEGGGSPKSYELPFVTLSPSSRGMYVGKVDFDKPGLWKVKARFSWPDSSDEEMPEKDELPQGVLEAGVQVHEKPQTPAPGDQAPRSKTKTLSSVGGDLSKLTSDPYPDSDFYSSSLDEVIGNGKRPVVVVFATPARCKSAVCGPVLEVAKAVKKAGSEAIFVHVDVFEKPLDTSDDTYVQAVGEWRLPTEPWTFVVRPDGTIADRIEGIYSPSQLEEAIAEAGAA
jgi:hypothetical protein